MYPYIEILTHTHTHIDTQKAWQHAHIHKHTTHCSQGPREMVGMDPALRATQSQSNLMIAQTFTPSIHFCSLSPAHAHTHTHTNTSTQQKKNKNAFRWSPSSLPHHSHRQGKKIKREEGHLDRKARRMERMCVLRTVWILLVGSHMVYWWGDDTLRVNLWNKNLKDESGENEPILKRCWLTDGT